MGRQYLALLDLMMGYVCAMIILIALSASNVGKGEVGEPGRYFFVEVEFKCEENEPSPLLPFAAAPGGVQETTSVKIGKSHYLSFFSQSFPAAEQETSPPAAQLVILDRFLERVEMDDIRRVSVFGELNPRGMDRTGMKSEEEFRTALQAVNHLTEIEVQVVLPAR